MDQKVKSFKKNENSKLQMFQREFRNILNDPSYRERVLFTLSIYMSFAVIGGTKGLLGPALLDLIAISGVDLSQGAYIVTFLYLGYTVGAMLNGVLYYRFQRTCLFSVCCFWMGITTSAIPWCSNNALMLAAHGILGLFQGVVDAGGNAEIIKLWTNDSQRFIVGLHLILNVGGVLSPLIIAPFLMKTTVAQNISSYDENREYDRNYNSDDNSTVTLRYSEIKISAKNISMENHTISGSEDKQVFTSRIHIAYVISTVFCLLAAVMFISLYIVKKLKWGFLSREEETKDDETCKEVSKKKSNRFKLTRRFKFFALVVMITISTLSKAIDHAFAAYLSAFCVDSMHWSTQASSYVTSTYFVCVVVGGICGTVMVKAASLVNYLGVQILLLLISFICLAFSVSYSAAAGIWVAASLFGFAKSVIFPLTLAWTNDSFVKISGKISSVFFTSTMAGSVTNPLLLGYIMTNISKMWFCYFFLFESVVLFIFYIIGILLTKYANQTCRETDDDQIYTM